MGLRVTPCTVHHLIRHLISMVEISSSRFVVTPCTAHHLIGFKGLHGWLEIPSSVFAVTPCTVHHLIRLEGLHGGDTK